MFRFLVLFLQGEDVVGTLCGDDVNVAEGATADLGADEKFIGDFHVF